jgi:class 3 adenylate cyclase
MVFVNNIGDIVHTMVDRYMGAANKNIGDAFLLVWKTRPETYSFEEDNVIWHDK